MMKEVFLTICFLVAQIHQSKQHGIMSSTRYKIAHVEATSWANMELRANRINNLPLKRQILRKNSSFRLSITKISILLTIPGDYTAQQFALKTKTVRPTTSTPQRVTRPAHQA